MVHHSWANLPDIDTGLEFRLYTPSLRSSLLEWLPIVGPIVLPQMRDFHMFARDRDGAFVALRIAFDQTVEEHNVIVGDTWPSFEEVVSAGNTDVVCDSDSDLFAEQSEVLLGIAWCAEHLLQGCEPRRLTAEKMEILMRKIVSEVSRGTIDF